MKTEGNGFSTIRHLLFSAVEYLLITLGAIFLFVAFDFVFAIYEETQDWVLAIFSAVLALICFGCAYLLRVKVPPAT